MRFIILTTAQAAAIRGETAEGAALDPREIMAGEHVGKFALPERVLEDPAHEFRWTGLKAKPVVDINPEEAWPPEKGV